MTGTAGKAGHFELHSFTTVMPTAGMITTIEFSTTDVFHLGNECLSFNRSGTVIWPARSILSSLRSFVAVADVGGVTRAAGYLNLTQSAVSMQIKRLEESLGQQLFDRSGRGVALTSAGEQLLSYARRMLELNDSGAGADDRPGLRGHRHPRACRMTSSIR